MKSPWFSIIVPLFNAEQYLSNCISSIINQNCKDFELILINDGSTDASQKICNEYLLIDERIKVIFQENKGVSSARNAGINMSAGKYIIFIDSDDIIEQGYLHKFMEISKKYFFDLIVMGFCTNNEVTNDNIKYYMENRECKNRLEISHLIPQLENKCLLSGPFAKCFKYSLIHANAISYDENISFGEDAIFNLTYLLNVESLAISDFIGYKYIQREYDSLVKKKYSYAKTINISDTITEYRNKVILKYKINDPDYSRFIKKEYTLNAMNAIISNYTHPYYVGREERISRLKIIFNKIDIKSIPSSSLYYRFIKIILITRYIPLIDLSLKVYLSIIDKLVAQKYLWARSGTGNLPSL